MKIFIDEKTIILALPLLALPFTAMAQDRPAQASKEVIDDVAKNITKSACKGGMKEVALSVYTCYQSTAKTSPDIEKCMIADYALMFVLKEFNKRAEVTGDPKLNFPYYNRNTFTERMTTYITLPQYQKYTAEKNVAYLVRSQEAVMDEVVKLRQSNYCDKK